MLRNGLANPRANLQDYTPFKDSDPYFQLLPPPPFQSVQGRWNQAGVQDTVVGMGISNYFSVMVVLVTSKDF